MPTEIGSRHLEERKRQLILSNHRHTRRGSTSLNCQKLHREITKKIWTDDDRRLCISGAVRYLKEMKKLFHKVFFEQDRIKILIKIYKGVAYTAAEWFAISENVVNFGGFEASRKATVFWRNEFLQSCSGRQHIKKGREKIKPLSVE